MRPLPNWPPQQPTQARHGLARSARVWAPLLAGLALLAGPMLQVKAATGLSNQQFAEQVRALRQQMAQQPAAVDQAALLCVNLPPHRAAEEPACRALQLHLRARAQARTEAAPSDWLPPALSRLIGRITGAA